MSATHTDEPSGVRSCWICLESDGAADAQSAGPWRKVCSCNLYAHENCLLKWAASIEQNNNAGGKPPSCPQCLRPIYIVKRTSLFLQLRDGVESFNSQTTSALVLTSVGSSIVLIFYTALYTLGSSAIRAICPPSMADAVLGASIDESGIRTIELTPRTTAIPAMVPILLVLARRTSTFANVALCLSPLMMASNNLPVWKFRNEKLVLALYPFLRLVYLKLYGKFIQPVIASIGKQLQTSRTKPSNDEGLLLEGFNFEVVLEEEPVDFDDDDEEDAAAGGLRRNIMGPLGGLINWIRGNNMNNQPRNAANDRLGNGDGAANARDPLQNPPNIPQRENEQRQPNGVVNGDNEAIADNLGENDEDVEDDMNWIVSKQRLSLQIGYALIWPWTSSVVGTILGNIPLVQRYIPSAFNRNILGSILVVAVRDVVNLLTAYLRLKQERSARVLNYDEAISLGLVPFFGVRVR